MINVYLCEDEEMQLDFIRCMLETGIAERKNRCKNNFGQEKSERYFAGCKK